MLILVIENPVLLIKLVISANPVCVYIYSTSLNKKVSEYDQEIPQSQTSDKPIVLRGSATKQSQYTRKTN